MEENYVKRIYFEIIMSMLGLVTENLRAVSFSVTSKDKISIRFFVSQFNDKEKEILEDILFEFEALYGSKDLEINKEIIESDIPIKELQQLEHIVFSRAY